MIKSDRWNMFKSTYLIESTTDYIEVLKDIADTEGDKELWFRGHNNEAWLLRPNIMRRVVHIEDAFGNPIDPHDPGFRSGATTIAFPDFRLQLPKIKKMAYDHGYIADNELELLAFGQHYGLQTPLIDWSEDPMVALFFAFDGLDKPTIEYYDSDGHRDYVDRKNYFINKGELDGAAAIFIMIPAVANKYSSILKEDIFTSKSFSKQVLDDLMGDKNYTWVCVKTPKIGYRISRQSGNFLWQGKDYSITADNSFYTHEFMYKIYIPYECYDDILSELNAMRLTKAAIYGEYDESEEFIQELKEDQIKRFEKSMKRLSESIRKMER